MKGKIYYYDGTITKPTLEDNHFIQFIDYFTSEEDLNEKLQKFYKNVGWEVMYERYIHTAENIRDIDFGSWTRFLRIIYDVE